VSIGHHSTRWTTSAFRPVTKYCEPAVDRGVVDCGRRPPGCTAIETDLRRRLPAPPGWLQIIGLGKSNEDDKSQSDGDTS
jgi:hypothetical protein